MAYNLMHFTANDKAEKLPLETEPVADDNNMVLSAKPGYQTSTVPYSTDNCSTRLCCLQRVYAKPATNQAYNLLRISPSPCLH